MRGVIRLKEWESHPVPLRLGKVSEVESSSGRTYDRRYAPRVVQETFSWSVGSSKYKWHKGITGVHRFDVGVRGGSVGDVRVR